MPPEELLECFNNIKYETSMPEVMQIFRDHNAHKTLYLPMDEFYAKLTCWSNYEQQKEIDAYELKEQADRLIERT